MIRELNDWRRRQMFQSKSRTSRLVRIESQPFNAMVTYAGYIFGRTDARTNSIRRCNETCICRFFSVDYGFRMQIRVFINANEKVGASQKYSSPLFSTFYIFYANLRVLCQSPVRFFKFPNKCVRTRALFMSVSAVSRSFVRRSANSSECHSERGPIRRTKRTARRGDTRYMSPSER